MKEDNDDETQEFHPKNGERNEERWQKCRREESRKPE
jgi:hypothetical protein